MSILNIASNVIYITIAMVIAIILYLFGITLSIYSLEYLTLPTESFKAIGNLNDSGIGLWVLTILDHIFRIFLLTVIFSISASLVSCLFKQIDNRVVSILLQIALGLLYTLGMWLHFSSKENYSLEEMPTIDIMFILFLFVISLYFIIQRESVVGKIPALFSFGGVVLALIACLIIQIIALAIAVYAHVFSTLLDTWTYVDMTAGTEWNLLHILISLFSHFHNILFFGGVCIIGIYNCYRVISFLIPDKTTTRFLQSAISLWSLEFLLYAVTDEKSMKGAMFDTFDFSVLIILFALISIFATIGMFESINED